MQVEQWRYTGRRSPRRKSHCYKQRRSRGAAPGVRAGKSSEFRERVVSTLDEPTWSKYSIALTTPPGHISSAHGARIDGSRVGMNVIAHQEMKKNEETK